MQRNPQFGYSRGDNVDTDQHTRRVDAVVLNWRDAGRTVECVRRLQRETLVDRIWLVDNESTGELAVSISTEAMRNVIVLPVETNLGFSAGMNIGLTAALRDGADYVLAQNNDAYLHDGSLAKLLNEFRDGEVGAVAPVILGPDGETQSTGGVFTRWLLRTSDTASGDPDYLTWAAVLLRAEALRDVGLLDERFFMYWEDVEFGLRLGAKGWRQVVARSAHATHESGASHDRAGAAILEYSTFGAVVLARVIGGPRATLGAVVRVAWRVVGNVLRLDWPRARAALIGSVRGLVATGPASAVYPRRSLASRDLAVLTPRIYVHLWYSLDTATFRAAHENHLRESGNEYAPDLAPYGYNYAEQYGAIVDYSVSHPERLFTRLARKAVASIVGFDAIHFLRNRHLARNADVVWTHTERESIAVALMLGRRSQRPKLLLQSVWLMDKWPSMSRLRRASYRYAFARADTLTFHSELNCADARREFVSPVELVKFGISETAWPITQTLQRPILKQAQVISVGNDIHRDWTTLVSALAEHGGIKVDVRSKTFDVNVATPTPSNFAVRTATSLSDLRADYARADIVVIPLRPNRHASGLTVLLEAVAMGRPVVASDVGGLRQYFDDDEVCFVPSGDHAALRAAVERLVGDHHARGRMAEMAQRRFVRENYTTRGYIERQLERSRALLNESSDV